MFELVKEESESSQQATQGRANTHNIINHDQIDWSPIGGANTNFSTHELEKVSETRIQVKNSGDGIMFSLVFLFGGFFWLFISMGQVDSTMLSKLFPWGCIPFFWIGISPFINTKTEVFDKSIGWFWFGSKKITRSSEVVELQQKCRLSKVAAVQVIDDDMLDVDGDYTCYELNIVMKNGKRYNIMRHGGRGMYKDGRMLAQFLDVPYFDWR